MIRMLPTTNSPLAHAYTAALKDHLRESGEATLERAYELGRQALAGHLGVLDMARLHYEALVRASAEPLPREAVVDTLTRAARFLVESLAPFEMTHRGFGDVSTALRASAERFRELYESTNDLVFTTDLAGDFRSMNRAGELATGYSDDEIRSLNLRTLIAPEHLGIVRRILKAPRKAAPDRQELEIVTKDGRRVPVEISLRLIAHDGLLVGVQGVARDVTDRKDAERALLALNQRLEEEARRIAHALHDEAGQLLASVYLALASLAAELPPHLKHRLAEVRTVLEQVEGQLRRLSHELRPTILDDLGLLPAVGFLAEGIAMRTGLGIGVTGSTGGRLPTHIETALYRVVQEGLINVTRHAQASRAVVHVERRQDTIVCSISDNGRGFRAPARTAEKATQGLGLIGIRERVAALDGTLSIASRPGAGTRLEITIPLKVAAWRPESSLPTTTSSSDRG